MNPAQSLAGALKGSGGHAIDAPVAALAGLAVAFAAFAMPPDLLAALVETTGIGGLLASAEPPLGFKARMILGAGGAVIAFALAFGLLRGIDRLGSRRAERELESDAEPPRLRRRDFHPDAPARAPLLAGCELGEPEPEADREAEPELLLRESPPPPAWLCEAEAVEPEAAPLETEPEPEAESEPEPEPAPEPAAAAPPGLGSSIPELMERLERGLARRRAEAPAPPPADPPAPFPEPSDDRLQSAIDSLQHLAARQG